MEGVCVEHYVLPKLVFLDSLDPKIIEQYVKQKITDIIKGKHDDINRTSLNIGIKHIKMKETICILLDVVAEHSKHIIMSIQNIVEKQKNVMDNIVTFFETFSNNIDFVVRIMTEIADNKKAVMKCVDNIVYNEIIKNKFDFGFEQPIYLYELMLNILSIKHVEFFTSFFMRFSNISSDVVDFAVNSNKNLYLLFEKINLIVHNAMMDKPTEGHPKICIDDILVELAKFKFNQYFFETYKSSLQLRLLKKMSNINAEKLMVKKFACLENTQPILYYDIVESINDVLKTIVRNGAISMSCVALKEHVWIDNPLMQNIYSTVIPKNNIYKDLYKAVPKYTYNYNLSIIEFDIMYKGNVGLIIANLLQYAIMSCINIYKSISDKNIANILDEYISEDVMIMIKQLAQQNILVKNNKLFAINYDALMNKTNNLI
jgi:hypothetical protein